jgi:3-oxoacyl-[acyl-carrier protein] reductase
MMDLGLRDRVYLVTGGSRGLGFAAAEALVADGTLSQDIPLRRYGEPAEFGQAAAFILSPAASYITGAMIPIDGGAIRSI